MRIHCLQIMLLSLLIWLLCAVTYGDEIVPSLLDPAADAGQVAIPTTLSWQAEPDVVAYECDVARDADFKDSVLLDQTVQAPRLTITHLLPGVLYYWHVRFKDAATWSETRTFQTAPAVPATARDGRVVMATDIPEHHGVIGIMNADGSGFTALTRGRMDAEPVLSPDGRRIAFTRDGGEGLFGTGGLWIMQADGSGLRKLSPAPCRVCSPHFTPASDTVIFQSEDPRGEHGYVCRINVDGTGFLRTPIEARYMTDPTLSADGTLLALCDTGIQVYRTTDWIHVLAPKLPFTMGPQHPCFSRDGRNIYTCAFADGSMKLSRISLDGGGESLLSSRILGGVCCSPDGSYLLYGDCDTGVWRLHPGDLAKTHLWQSSTDDVSWQAAAGDWTPPAPQPEVTGQTAPMTQPVLLHWTPMPGVTGYEVQVATDADWTHVVTDHSGYGAGYLLAPLPAKCRYFWRVRARFRAAPGDWSPMHSFTTAAQDIALLTGSGRVHGSVLFEDGKALANSQVTVDIHGTQATFTTGTDGHFDGAVPAGTGTARVEGDEQPLTILPNKVTSITLTMKLARGIVLTADIPKQASFILPMSAASRVGARHGPQVYMDARVIRPGFLWYPEVPRDHLEFACIWGLRGSLCNGFFVKRWTFTQPATIRRLTMTIPTAIHVQLAIQDMTGHPIAHANMTGKISCTLIDIFHFWPDIHRDDNPVNISLNAPDRTCSTDNDGKLDLEMLPPNTYQLTLKSPAGDDYAMKLIVNDDGTYSPHMISPAKQ